MHYLLERVKRSDFQIGVVRCFLAEGQLADAIAQMEFLLATHPKAMQSEVC